MIQRIGYTANVTNYEIRASTQEMHVSNRIIHCD